MEKPLSPKCRSALAQSAGYGVTVALVLAPLLCAAVPPLVDYPDYLARAAILAQPGASRNYEVAWQIVPNLAFDLVVPWLGALVGIETAGRLFIALTMAMLMAGTASLHRALFGRVGWWPLASALFVYNVALYFGFLNYLFGLGGTLLCFAAWVSTGRSPLTARLCLFAVLAGLLFVLHLFAFGLYGLLIGAFELGALTERGARTRRAALRCAAAFLQFVPAGLLWLTNSSAGEPHYTSYGNLAERYLMMLWPMDFGQFGWQVAPAYAGLAYLAWRGGGLRLDPRMRWPLLAVIVATAAMPEWLYGSWSADSRLPVALPFLLIGSMRLSVSKPRLTATIAGFSVFLLVLRVATIALVWHEMDRRFAEFRTAAAALPPGSRLLVGRSEMPDRQRRIGGLPLELAALNDNTHFHLPELAIIDRDAFVPNFGLQLAPVRPTLQNRAVQGQASQPIEIEELVAALQPDRRAPGEPPYWTDWPHRFDYLLVLDFGNHDNPSPQALQPLATGSFFSLYRIVPGRQN